MTQVPRGSTEPDQPLVYDGMMVEVVIEIPRWSFLKRGSTGAVDFVSPLPCPCNYGSIPDRIGLEGDLLDAVVLGPRLARGTRLYVPARASVGLAERGLYDDKLICSHMPISPATRDRLVLFFGLYITLKRALNLVRGLPTDGACTGWDEADAALARSKPREPNWVGPPVHF